MVIQTEIFQMDVWFHHQLYTKYVSCKVIDVFQDNQSYTVALNINASTNCIWTKMSAGIYQLVHEPFNQTFHGWLTG